VLPADLQRACRGQQAARLETLATRLPPAPDDEVLCLDDPTHDELEALEARCRLREELAGQAGGHSGVRVLFAGASGTGKTLAARRLAAALGKDLYRIDLAAAVNKYLGETEKSLNNAFCAAEELDVVLLLDEGDALMAGRTDVGNANDRYANLETNFLLQRIESFNGILVVTTNAADRIDAAFARRMDVVVPFRAPDEWQRYRMLGQHLAHDGIDDALLQEVATRCTLSGAQLHNVVLHARLLALRAGGALDAGHLHAALVREYRKTGGHCPLRLPPAAGAG
jgi:SpoVK/Ycf46/Vps4 family AAA+-type ATPase